MIIVINFGGQTCHLIARRMRNLGVRAEVLPSDVNAGKILKLNPSGIVLSGGPSSVYEKGSPQMDKKILELGIPVLGICYGSSLQNTAMEKCLTASSRSLAKQHFMSRRTEKS